jgi:hypothetical protein
MVLFKIQGLAYGYYVTLYHVYITEIRGDRGRECKVGAGAGSSAPETAGFTARISAAACRSSHP